MHNGDDNEGPNATPTARIRFLEMTRNLHVHEGFGFLLTRTKWDPYPWICKVERDSPADSAGARAGHCLLRVNGEDVVGQRVSEVAEVIRHADRLALTVWDSGIDPHCTPETLCCGPMPDNLQKLSVCMSSILEVLECPVCFDTIPPPAHQCDNGHLICLRCRTKAEKCPVCRSRLSRGRSILADKVYNTVTDVFNLRVELPEIRRVRMEHIFQLRKGKRNEVPDIRITSSSSPSNTNTFKLLAKFVGKSPSVENLASNTESEGLKSKSLSAYEIRPELNEPTSGSARSRLLSTTARKSDHRYGSFESLYSKDDSNLLTVPSTVAAAKSPISYHCPYRTGCFDRIKGSDILTHFEQSHTGPLIQYFQSKIEVSVAALFNEDILCYIINTEGRLFFFRRLNIVDTGSANLKDLQIPSILLCTLMLDTQENSTQFQMEIHIFNSAGDVLLTFQNPVYNLSTTTTEDIQEQKRGVFLSSQSLSALDLIKPGVYFTLKISKI